MGTNQPIERRKQNNPLCVERGTEPEFSKTLDILERAGYTPCTCREVYETGSQRGCAQIFTKANEYGTFVSMHQSQRFTPAEFHELYGEFKPSRFQYPFKTEGEIVIRNGKGYQKPESKQSMILETPVKCFVKFPAHPDFMRNILAIVAKSSTPFHAEDFAYDNVWVEVDPPEVPPIKEYTQEELVKLVGHDFKLKVEKK